MANKTLIFTATYNEADNIEVLINKILSLKLDLDILIIDDNSPDLTWKIIEKIQEKNNNITLIKRGKKEGLDTAHKFAYRFAKSKNYKNLVTLDADLSHDPIKISDFISQLETSVFVIGSRYMLGGGTCMKGFRLFLSYFGNKFIKFMFAVNCSEFTTSYRGFDLKKLENFDLENVSSKGYSFFMETIFLINKSGYKIDEIPIFFTDRLKGVSKIPKIEIIRTFFNVIKLKFFK